MREIWTEDEAEFHGQYVDFDPIAVWPKPVQQPHPLIYVGGGRKAFNRIAELGDAWLANGLPPDKLEPMLEELAETAGREVPVTVFGASSKLEDLEGYERLGVERILLMLPTLPANETLDHLDELAQTLSPSR
jgi:alkanesulfonate monooxygenase SsuD/methylene tetrahydromethanopterin reductase-like flavin-dependent oxidoreductase (luciferase family)